MRTEFTVAGQAAPEVRKVWSTPKGPRGVRGPVARQWEAHLRAQALPYAPKELIEGAVSLTVEFVRKRPKYLMAPKYCWRCASTSRKCGWKGGGWENVEMRDGILYGAPRLGSCPQCGGVVRPPTPTPPHTVKPDLTNLIKVCEDALKGLMWGDDSQVAGMRLTKRFAELGESPHVDICMETEG